MAARGSSAPFTHAVVVIVWMLLLSLCEACVSPPSCQCDMIGPAKRPRGRKVNCSKQPNPFKTLTGITFPPDSVTLDLSFNELVQLKQGSFIQLSKLKKLKLNNNRIAVIEAGAFEGLQNLKRLDLSDNLIGAVNSNIFSGLPRLQKLFLSGNRIATIPDGTFNDLRFLKRIEFNSPNLQCDCYLRKVLKWSQVRNVKITGTVCAFPKKMRGKAVGDLRRRELVCNRDFKLKVFDIRPSESQLVFKGDKLPFECYASRAPGLMEIAWYRSGHLVTTNASRGVSVHTSHNTDRTIVNHKLIVESLDASHAGKWSCVVTTQSGNHTKTVIVDVRVPEVVLECPAVQNRTAKGVFRWEQSVAGLVVTQPCQRASEQGGVASHTCGPDGYWTGLNISACDFTKDITRKLSLFSQITIANLDIPTLTHGVRKALVTAAQKREVMDSFDVLYVTKIMATLLPYSFDKAEVATLLVNMVSNVSSLSPKVLSSAQIETRSPARIVKMLEKMGEQMQPQPQPEGLYPQPVEAVQMKPQQPVLWSGVSHNVLMVVMDQERVLSTGVSCLLEGPDKAQHQHGQTGVETLDDDADSETEPKQTNLAGSKFYCSTDAPSTNARVHVRIPAILRTPLPEKDPTTPEPSTSDSNKEKEEEEEEEDTTVVDIDSINATVTPGLFSNSSEIYNASLDSSSLAFLQDDPSTYLDPASPYRPTASKSNSGPSFSPSSSSSSSLQSSSYDKQGKRVLPPSSSESFSFPVTEEQLAALNISSKYFSKFPSSLNVSSPVFDQSSFSALAAKRGFSFASSPVLLGKASLPPRRRNVYLLAYSTGRLFPVLLRELGDPAFRQGNWSVVTPVIGVSLGDTSLKPHNLSEPIVFTFKVLDYRRPLKAAFFDFAFINGFGGWRTDGCRIVKQNGSLVTVQVDHLSNFALLQDLSVVLRLASFPMEPVIYAGSGFCIICMIIVISTFISCYGTIGIPKKIKHAVINVCLSTLLMLGIFLAGINRTDMELPCQIAGICIHYFTLCAVFWITLTTNITYKKFLKASRPPEPPPELGPMPLPPKPILQFYFVGYGVPLIICGITAAVNLHFYAGMKYCFLEWEPSLGAFYAPVTLLVAWNLILFMRISCVVRSAQDFSSEAVNDSDNEIHTNEIELVPSQPDTITSAPNHHGSSHRNHNNNNNYSHSSNHPMSNGGLGYRGRFSRASTEEEEEDAVSVVSIPDQERRPITQLRSLVAILFLFIVMWMCGALAIAKPFHRIIPSQELIFSYAYGIMSTFFGVFLVSYFCLTRKDWRLSSKRRFGCAPPETYSPPMEVTEPSPLPPPEETVPTPIQANGNAIKSNSNTNLSLYSQKSSNITKAYNMKNNSKQSNINLVIPNPSEISFGSTQENYPNFYNPRQNGAAKKFWQKHRHHSKIMNKDINRDLNSSLTDNNSASEMNHHNRHRRPSSQGGTSSDANTHLSIEIQIQAKDSSGRKAGGSFSGSRDIPVHINNNNNTNNNQHPGLTGSSCGAISLEHNHASAALNRSSTSPDREGQLAPANPSSNLSSPHLQQLPQQRSPSTNSLGTGNYPSAFTPVQPRSSNNLAGPQQASDTTNNINHGIGDEKQEGPHREGSVPRTPLQAQDLEPKPAQTEQTFTDPGTRPPNPGVTWNPYPSHHLPPLPPSHHQPHTYNFAAPPPTHSNTQHYGFDYPPSMAPINTHMYNMPYSSPVPHGNMSPTAAYGPPPMYNIPPSPYILQPGQPRVPVQSRSPVSSSSQSQANQRQHRRRRSSGNNSSRPLSGGDSSDSSRPKQRRTQQGSSSSPGRCVRYAEHSPVASDSQAYMPQALPQGEQHQAGKARSVDSDHHSDPTHRKKHHRVERSYKHNKKLSSKQRSLGWVEQFGNRPSKVNYVYVNHMYRDKVMHKLIKQASESDDLASKAFWLPRSASEYERLTQKGFCNMAEDTSSSSEDEDSLDDNVWIKQSSGSDFQKKETSV